VLEPVACVIQAAEHAASALLSHGQLPQSSCLHACKTAECRGQAAECRDREVAGTSSAASAQGACWGGAISHRHPVPSTAIFSTTGDAAASRLGSCGAGSPAMRDAETQASPEGTCDVGLQASPEGTCDVGVQASPEGTCDVEVQASPEGTCHVEVQASPEGTCHVGVQASPEGTCDVGVQASAEGLGFPGEGPLIVATYNINGSRGTLAAVLAQAKQAKIDILLLQELHFYEDGEHGRVGSLADRQGWTLVHSPATRIDPSSGVAIAVRTDSRCVKPIVSSARSVIRGRYPRKIHHTSYGQSLQSTGHNSHPRTEWCNTPPTTNKQNQPHH